MFARYKWRLVLLIVILLLTACSGGVAPTPEETSGEPAVRVLTVMTHDSFDVSEEVVQVFSEEYNVELRFLAGGDTGSALNQLILSKSNPPADVFYGLDNTFLSRALVEGIFEVYDSPLLADTPDHFELDSQHRALPVDYGDVCLNYDRAYFAEAGLEPPESLQELLLPEFQGLLVVENPATSSPGLAFLLATISSFGDPGYLEFWQGLVKNDVLVVNDWDSAYYTEFSLWGGTRPIVVSYSSSPPFEKIFAEQPIDEPPTAAVVSGGSCFRQIEFVGILQGTENRDLAEQWVDFMLSPVFQEDMPLKMAVFPVNSNARLDPQFEEFLVIPDQPASLDPQLIAEMREQWIRDWTEMVLR